MSDTLEKKLILPKSLENAFETEDARYVGRAFNLQFEGTTIQGDASLSKYRKSEVGLYLNLFPLRLETRPKREFMATISHSYFIDKYRPARKRDDLFGYRTYLFRHLTNRCIDVSDELFDRVFGPIDEKLMRIYSEAFPGIVKKWEEEKEKSEKMKREHEMLMGEHGKWKREHEMLMGEHEKWKREHKPRIRSIEGKVEYMNHARTLLKDVTLYTIRDDNDLLYRVGVYGIHNDLQNGDHVKIEFDENETVACEGGGEDSLAEPLPGQIQVIRLEPLKWGRIVGYQKLNR